LPTVHQTDAGLPVCRVNTLGGRRRFLRRSRLSAACLAFLLVGAAMPTPAIDLLMQYHWPGNVRELENCIERAVLICDDDSIKSIHLPPSLQTADNTGNEDDFGLSFARAVENFEKELIVASLKRTGGNQTKSARELGTSLRIINYKIGKYMIDCRQFKTAKK